jgi:hypothetical protein
MPVSFLSNEKTQVSEYGKSRPPKWTANLAGGDKRKKVCGTHFVKKLMGVL